MSKIDELIKEKCLEGVEYRNILDVISMKARVGWQALTKKEYLQDGDYYLITGTDFRVDGSIGFDSCVFVSKERFDMDEKIKIHANDILMTKDGTLGKVAFMKTEPPKPATLNGGVYRLTVISEEVLPRFMYHYFNSYEFKCFVEKVKTGGTIKHLTQKWFETLRIPVPPIEVQQEIVCILDSFTELELELQAELEVRKKQYEYYRDKLMDNANGRKGKLIEMLCQPVTDGPHTTPKLVSEGIPFISATAIHEGRIHFEDAQGFITKEFDEECAKKYKPKRDDVYMVKSGSTTGKVGYVDTDVDFNIWSPLAAMRVNSENSARYLFHLLQTQTIQHQVSTRMSHGSQPNLSMRVLEQFDVIIPTLQEQIRIVNILEKYDTLCNDNEKGLPAEIKARHKQYEYYRDKLLTFKRKEV